jgi:hypothetical protein
MTRLKMVQKSLGVILGSLVEPKATFGRLRLTGTMRVGERYSGGRLPFGGHASSWREEMMERRCNGLDTMRPMSAVRREKVSFMVNEAIDFLCLDKRMLRKTEKIGEGG